jgi:ABC-type bacteriocin/lantibiotic exporter with double-glycine peptidase domain
MGDKMKQVVILSGISGSGKSTLAEEILQDTQGVKVSADHYFMKDGEYRFDASKLTEAHASCFRNFLNYLQDGLFSTVVVDNTNIEVFEIAAYYQAAIAFGYDPNINTIRCGNWDEVAGCARRNVHRVPSATVYRQHEKLSKRILPSFWKNTVQWMV